MSLITDTLSDPANLVDVGVGAVETGVWDALPALGIAGFAESLAHPSVAPGVLSYLTQTYLNPAMGGGYLAAPFSSGYEPTRAITEATARTTTSTS